jgi:hypothetical protein
MPVPASPRRGPRLRSAALRRRRPVEPRDAGVELIELARSDRSVPTGSGESARFHRDDPVVCPCPTIQVCHAHAHQWANSLGNRKRPYVPTISARPVPLSGTARALIGGRGGEVRSGRGRHHPVRRDRERDDGGRAHPRPQPRRRSAGGRARRSGGNEHRLGARVYRCGVRRRGGEATRGRVHRSPRAARRSECRRGHHHHPEPHPCSGARRRTRHPQARADREAAVHDGRRLQAGRRRCGRARCDHLDGPAVPVHADAGDDARAVGDRRLRHDAHGVDP